MVDHRECVSLPWSPVWNYGLWKDQLIQNNVLYETLTLVSTSVHCSSTLLSRELDSLRLLKLDNDPSLLKPTCSFSTELDGRSRDDKRKDCLTPMLVEGIFGRECSRTSTSVNWTEVPPPRVRRISPCTITWQCMHTGMTQTLLSWSKIPYFLQ